MAQLAAEHSESVAAENPIPLGLFALALTTFLIGISFTGTTLVGGGAKAIAGVLLFAGLLQLLAGLWDLRRGNTHAGTVIATFGALALAAGFTSSWNLGGYGFLAVAVVTLLFLLGSWRGSIAWIVTLALLFLSFLGLTIGGFGVSALTTIGGYIGILAALAALYTGWAGLTHTDHASFHLPV